MPPDDLHLSYYLYGSDLTAPLASVAGLENQILLSTSDSRSDEASLSDRYTAYIYPGAGQMVVCRRASLLQLHERWKFDPLQAATPNFIDHQAARGYQARFKCNQYARDNRLFVFTTLKYDYVDGRLAEKTLKRDPGKLMARIRAHHGPTPYLGVGEVGEQFGGFHWHFLLPSGISQEELQEKWLRGSIHYKQLPTYDELRNVVNYMSKGFDSESRKFKRRYVKAQNFEPERITKKGLTIEEARDLASQFSSERSDTIEVIERPNDYTRLMVTWDPS